jgi:DNA-binding NarL/FixJ family response regulator
MELAPDAILLDIRMPFIDGIKVARQLRAASLGSKIIMLTSMEDTSCVDSAMAAGADGFVFKRKMATDLIKAIDTVLGGGNFISSDCELRRDPELTLNFV